MAEPTLIYWTGDTSGVFNLGVQNFVDAEGTPCQWVQGATLVYDNNTYSFVNGLASGADSPEVPNIIIRSLSDTITTKLTVAELVIEGNLTFEYFDPSWLFTTGDGHVGGDVCNDNWRLQQSPDVDFTWGGMLYLGSGVECRTAEATGAVHTDSYTGKNKVTGGPYAGTSYIAGSNHLIGWDDDVEFENLVSLPDSSNNQIGSQNVHVKVTGLLDLREGTGLMLSHPVDEDITAEVKIGDGWKITGGNWYGITGDMDYYLKDEARLGVISGDGIGQYNRCLLTLPWQINVRSHSPTQSGTLRIEDDEGDGIIFHNPTVLLVKDTYCRTQVIMSPTMQGSVYNVTDSGVIPSSPDKVAKGEVYNGGLLTGTLTAAGGGRRAV